MITLIHKYAVTTFIEELSNEVNDAWSLVSKAHVPIYLETSSAQFAPFIAFTKLLEQAHNALPTHQFIHLLQASADKFISKMGFDSDQSPSLQTLTQVIPITSLTIQENASTYSIELEAQQPDQLVFLAELYLLVTTHRYLKALNPRLNDPVKYHLQHSEASDLIKLQISNRTPQFLGHQQTALFYHESIAPKSITGGDLPTRISSTALSYAEQVRAALEGYVGREDLSIEQLSQILEMNERTIQRRLKSEGKTFRKIKESLNIAFAKRVMIQRNASISDVAEHLGYSDTSQFIRAFRKSENTTPLQWLKNARGT
ncbi:AraC family transcriptional regulator [Vibrio sp. D404a]|uniref:helix-turn-helix transcriptional regulator n=1 Tax=unclassified Vibrio TaxID=2614977 RepID=UPI002556B3AD|nr:MULTISPECIES: AraC family transcriptional regulator [unclassified Vibrio]MDK9735992.1 AraC family transcriptional regulator [Vibrio sp. D404a]MDK9797842.1 AraC family transcriptional regulator [Vibrio sp. D449a]